MLELPYLLASKLHLCLINSTFVKNIHLCGDNLHLLGIKKEIMLFTGIYIY